MTHAERLAEARTMYNEYLKAEKAVLQNQSYTIKDRTFERASLFRIIEGRKYWWRILNRLEKGQGGMRVRRALPRDV